MDTAGREEGKAKVYKCHHMGGNQLFTYTRSQRVQSYNLCLDVEKASGEVQFKTCDEKSKSQKWLHNRGDGTIKSVKRGLCLAVDRDSSLALVECDPKDKKQQWTMKY